jgi:hypothetical protein
MFCHFGQKLLLLLLPQATLRSLCGYEDLGFSNRLFSIQAVKYIWDIMRTSIF